MLTVSSYAPSAHGISHTSGVDSPNAGVSRGTATSRGELEGTKAGLQMPAANDATKGKYGGVTRHAMAQRMIGAGEV
jgi:hypothetical protein